jgi:glycerol-3-phosphate acyltransferase PlsY
MVGGVAAILGHNWPVYFSFKGGKGALTSFTVVMMMDWRIGLILLGVFIIIVAVTRYVSLGSIISAALFPVLSSIPVFQKTTVFIVLALLLGLLVIVRHHANISRLVKGTEAKLGAKKNI